MHFVNAVKTLSIRLHSMSFYAVARGHQIGVYNNWNECEQQVKGFKGAKYKKFLTRVEAESFIKNIGKCEGQEGTTATNLVFAQDFAVALGTKGSVNCKKETKEQETTISQNVKLEDFWPKSDISEENAFTDAELIDTMIKIEGIPSNMIDRGKKRKLAYISNATSIAKLPKHSSRIWEAVGLKKFGDFEFEIDEEDFCIVYTDGSCINNGSANACAGYGVYFGDNHPLNAAKPVLGRVTNNVGEIQAAIHAIKVAKNMNISKLCISTDSQFLINAITVWIGAWKKNNWCLNNGKPVKNVVDFKELDQLLQDDNLYVKWNYVKAHYGIKGNEMADKLAREGSDMHRRMHSK